MGQKINPTGFRLGPLYSWGSNWYAKGEEYHQFLLEDLKLREYLFERLKLAGITKVQIDRSINTVSLTVHVARPGVVIGRGGSGLEELKKEIAGKLVKPGVKIKKPPKFELNVVEVKKPDLSSRLVGLRLADQLIKRYPHPRAVSQALEKVMTAGALGVKVVLSGRIGGGGVLRRGKKTPGRGAFFTLRAGIGFF